MATLEVRNVAKVFGAQRSVDTVNLTVADGELLVLLGPSGCGKSTLMRLIAGLEIPTEGDVLIGGRTVTQLRPKDRNVAMVFQSYALYPHLTIYENIAFPLRVRGRMSNAEIAAKVAWAAELVDITRLLQRKPRQASGGERQRAALARSLVRDPSVFLLDEPLSNLDAKMRNTAREELRYFQNRTRVTWIHVTHDQTEAMGLGDRIVVMDHGRIRQIGSPEEIYNAPADTFVATFIGSPPMNLVDLGQDRLGFRPEHFQIATHFAAGTDLLHVPVRVQRMEYLGNERLYYGVIEGGDMPETRIVAREAATDAGAIAEGALATFAIERSRLAYFDRESGKALPAPGGASRKRALNG